MKPKAPAWTGLIFTIITIAGINLPYLEVNGQLYSLFQTLCLAGLKFQAWSLLGGCFMCVPAALWGEQWYLPFFGGVSTYYMGIAVAAIAHVIGIKPMFQYLRSGVWFCFAGAAGLLLCPVFHPVDRVLHRELLSYWKDSGYPLEPPDGV